MSVPDRNPFTYLFRFQVGLFALVCLIVVICWLGLVEMEEPLHRSKTRGEMEVPRYFRSQDPFSSPLLETATSWIFFIDFPVNYVYSHVKLYELRARLHRFFEEIRVSDVYFDVNRTFTEGRYTVLKYNITSLNRTAAPRPSKLPPHSYLSSQLMWRTWTYQPTWTDIRSLEMTAAAWVEEVWNRSEWVVSVQPQIGSSENMYDRDQKDYGTQYPNWHQLWATPVDALRALALPTWFERSAFSLNEKVACLGTTTSLIQVVAGNSTSTCVDSRIDDDDSTETEEVLQSKKSSTHTSKENLQADSHGFEDADAVMYAQFPSMKINATFIDELFGDGFADWLGLDGSIAHLLAKRGKKKRRQRHTPRGALFRAAQAGEVHETYWHVRFNYPIHFVDAIITLRTEMLAECVVPHGSYGIDKVKLVPCEAVLAHYLNHTTDESPSPAKHLGFYTTLEMRIDSEAAYASSRFRPISHFQYASYEQGLLRARHFMQVLADALEIDPKTCHFTVYQ